MRLFLVQLKMRIVSSVRVCRARPFQSQSDEPSDLRGSLEPHECIQHLAVPGGHPSTYEPGAIELQ